MRKAVLDRFEGPMAVFILEESGEVISCLRHEIGSELSEGDHVLLKIEGERIFEWHPDTESTEAARKRIEEKLARLRRG